MALKKFLFVFELEVGGFVIGMFGFTTTFLIDVLIVMLLYQTDCLGLFKLYTFATVVSYYMFASFMLVREIFCDVSKLNYSIKCKVCLKNVHKSIKSSIWIIFV